MIHIHEKRKRNSMNTYLHMTTLLHVQNWLTTQLLLFFVSAAFEDKISFVFDPKKIVEYIYKKLMISSNNCYTNVTQFSSSSSEKKINAEKAQDNNKRVPLSRFPISIHSVYTFNIIHLGRSLFIFCFLMPFSSGYLSIYLFVCCVFL